jgi:phasin family protein
MAAKNDAKTTPFQTVDTDKVMAAQQRNLDAFASAGQIVVDGVKAIAQRQSEMVQGSVDLWMAASQSTFSGKPGDFAASDQVAKAKTAYETAIANARELTEIAMKAQSEAANVMTKCMMANIDDMKTFSKVN